MIPNISALSQFQIDNFFLANPSVTQEACNEEAERRAGCAVTPTLSQGGASYTVRGGPLIVQFRTPNSDLDMKLLKSIEQAYIGFVPRHEYRGRLGDVLVYVMSDIGGVCMYLARAELQNNNYKLLRVMLDDYAEFLASAYHNIPIDMKIPCPTHMLNKYTSQLLRLRLALPSHFHAHLDKLIPVLPSLFNTRWPLVPNHIDLFENNIHVDPGTGRLTGICGWHGAEVSPFGTALGWVEVALGTLTYSGDFWRYHSAHEELRAHFWTFFYGYCGGLQAADRRCLETARLVGLFLTHGLQGNEPVAAGSEELGFGRSPAWRPIVSACDSTASLES
ncbi:hypothetical protein NHJ6243_001089 [Beauveria neobassiana]